jgi:hypothetical protein
MFENINMSIPGWGTQIEPEINMIATGIVIILLVIFVCIWLIIRR